MVCLIILHKQGFIYLLVDTYTMKRITKNDVIEPTYNKHDQNHEIVDEIVTLMKHHNKFPNYVEYVLRKYVRDIRGRRKL